MIRLALNQVRKSFGSNEVLRDINLELGQGEFHAIVGPSGVGKSTLLRIAAGLVMPTAGSVLIDGRSMQTWKKEVVVGFLFQTPVLLPWRTALRNVALPLEAARGIKPFLDPMAALALVGLGDSANLYPWQLSGGMQQRVALARSLVYQTRLLLMDEPLGALDAITRRRLQIEIGHVCRELQQTVLLVTHDLTEAVFMADRIAVLVGKPARLVETRDVPLDHPRHPSMLKLPAFQRMIEWLHEQLARA